MSSEKLKNQIQIKLESRIESALREFHGEIDKKVKKAIIEASKDLSKKLAKSIEKAAKKAPSTVIIINKTDKKLPIPALAPETPPKIVKPRTPRTSATTAKPIENSAVKTKRVGRPKSDLKPAVAAKTAPAKTASIKPVVVQNPETAPAKSSTPRASRKKNT